MEDAFNLEGYHYSDFNIIKIINNTEYYLCNSRSINGCVRWLPLNRITYEYYKVEINRDRNAGLLSAEMLRGEGKIYKVPAWTLNCYIVSFSPNGGEGEMQSIKCTYNNEYKLKKNIFTKNNNRFAYWYIYKLVDGVKYYYYKGEPNITGYYINGQEPKGYKKCCFYEGDKIYNLTSENNCVLIAEAQWKSVKQEFTLGYLSGVYTEELELGEIPNIQVPIKKATTTTQKKFIRKGYKYDYWNIIKFINQELYYWCVDKTYKNGRWFKYDNIPKHYNPYKFKHGANLFFNAKEGSIIYFTPVWIKEI